MMKKYWELNSRFLSDNHKHFLEKINSQRIEIKECKDGFNLTALIKLSASQNILLHSVYDPVLEAKNFAAKFSGCNQMILFGFGLGYPANGMLDNLDSLTNLTIVVLNNDIFKTACEELDLTKILGDKRVNLIIGLDDLNFIEQLTNVFDGLTINSARIAIWLPEIKVILPEFLMLKEMLDLFIIRQRGNLAYQETVLYNFKKNLSTIIQSTGIDSLAGQLAGLPAVIVSAGPSLQKSLPILKKGQNKVIIICVGTALKTLLKNDIIPDLVVITDAKATTYQQIEGCNVNIPLIFFPGSCAEVVEKYSGFRIAAFPMFDLIFTEINKVLNKGLLPSGGSVATVACSASITLGCKPIILLGQDLSLGSEGEIYGTNELKDLKISSSNLHKIRGIDGQTKVTLDNFYSFIKWFSDLADKRPDISLINCTADGADISGIKHRDFALTLAEFCTTEIKKPVLDLPVLTDENYDLKLSQLEPIFKRFGI